MVECILLIGSDSFAEQTSTDDQKEVGYYEEEDRKCCEEPGSRYLVIS